MTGLAAAFVSILAGAVPVAEHVSIPAGGVVLAATLHLPASTTPRPAVVLVHGSGPGTRDQLQDETSALTALGLAVLAYDKRGAGDSTGDWTSSSLADLAADARAALAWVRKHPDVDAGRAGYWGVSQAGWVLPEAAKRSDPAFLIIVSGGGLDPEAVERHQYLGKLEHAGASEQALAAARTLLDQYFGYLRDGSGYEELMSAVQRLRPEPWFTALGLSRVIPRPERRAAWAWVADLDAGAQVKSLRVPTLVLLGRIDPLMPVDSTRDAWQRNPCDGCGPEVIVVGNAGHGLRSGPHGGPLVPEFTRTTERWLRDIGVLP